MRLKQILLNLLSNACNYKFTKEGEVALRVRKVADGRDFESLKGADFVVAPVKRRLLHGDPIRKVANHRTKGPKTERGKRTIAIDDALVALLRAEREKHLRIMALSLIKLPDGALMFPSPPAPGEDYSFTKLRSPDSGQGLCCGAIPTKPASLSSNPRTTSWELL
jgi:hypothetical protein